MQTGEWPKHDIDHKNGVAADNSWENLREATNQQNQWNRRHNGKLPRGVYRARSGGRFWARVVVGKTMKHLGTFDTPEEAHGAWRTFVENERGQFFRAG